MTKEVLNPMMTNYSQMGAGFANVVGNQEANTTPSAAQSVVSGAETWNCACGTSNIASKFCPECGAKKPEQPKGWNCACGATNIMSKFCPECGAKRPEEESTWNCACGKQGITSKFCPECGSMRGDGQ